MLDINSAVAQSATLRFSTSSRLTSRRQCVVDKHKNCLLSWKLDPLSNDIYKLANCEVLWYKVSVQNVSLNSSDMLNLRTSFCRCLKWSFSQHAHRSPVSFIVSERKSAGYKLTGILSGNFVRMRCASNDRFSVIASDSKLLDH